MPGLNSQHRDVPVRIVKKNGAQQPHHGGAWKVAYADFVTAMMALFIVLWIIGQSKQVRQYVAHYFKDPGAFFENTRGGGMFQGNSIVNKDHVQDDLLKREQKKLQAVAEKLREELSKESGLKELIKQVKMEIVKEGLRIELQEGSESFFFDIGTATMKPEAVQILSTISQEIGKLPNHIIVEGHTDSRQYPQPNGYTNFELSTDRANSARRVLITKGMREKQFDEVRGYADTKLRNTQDPFDKINRRISIIIKYEG